MTEGNGRGAVRADIRRALGLKRWPARWSRYNPPSRKLCIDGNEYRRRQRARAKRRRR